MTDLNTTNPYLANQYLYRQNMPIDANSYGNAPAAFPISSDDPRFEPVKDNFKTNPLGKVAEGIDPSKHQNWYDIPLKFVLGGILAFGLFKLNTWLIKGDDAKQTPLGRIAQKAENISQRFSVLRFGWLKTAYENTLGRIPFVKTFLNADIAKHAQPRSAFVKGMITPAKNAVVKEFLEEALRSSKIDEKGYKHLLKLVEENANHPKTQAALAKAYKIASELMSKGAAPSAKLQMLKNRAELLMTVQSPLAKMAVKAHHSLIKVLNFAPAGGKMGKVMAVGGFLMAAYFLGESAKKTVDAPKNEKGSTFAHALLVDFVAGWMVMDHATRFMYKSIAGLKSFDSKSSILKCLTKPLNWIGKFAGMGLQKVAPKADSSVVTRGAKHIFNFSKGSLGSVVRMLLVMAVIFPTVEKISRAITHRIFGKPEALLAKEKAEEEKSKSSDSPKGEKDYTDPEKLQAALESERQSRQNTGMLTVDSQKNSMVEKRMKERLEQLSSKNPQNIAGSSLKISDLNKVPAEESKSENPSVKTLLQPAPTYMPSDTRKIPLSLESPEKQQEIATTIAKTDRVLQQVQNTLASV